MSGAHSSSRCRERRCARRHASDRRHAMVRWLQMYIGTVAGSDSRVTHRHRQWCDACANQWFHSILMLKRSCAGCIRGILCFSRVAARSRGDIALCSPSASWGTQHTDGGGYSLASFHLSDDKIARGVICFCAVNAMRQCGSGRAWFWHQFCCVSGRLQEARQEVL